MADDLGSGSRAPNGHAGAPDWSLRSRPGLGAISFAPEAGGVGYVARLLRQVLVDVGAAPWLVELGVKRRDLPGAAMRARFFARLVAGTLVHRADWMLFSHVGVARAQRAIPRAIRAPYGVFVHDIEAWDPDLAPDRLRTLMAATVVISNSAYTAKRVEAAHGDKFRVITCPLGLLDAEPATDAPDQQLLDACGPRAVLVVGRVMSDERYKGHDHLIEAMPAVRAAMPDARLVIAGWGDDIDRLRQKASSLGVGDAVITAGFVSDATLDALFRRVLVYAMPSAREGFGLVYLEAMRHGVPCVGSTLDAAGEVIAHGESGFVIDRDRPGALAEALTALLRDSSLRASMGEAGRRRFHACFTYEHFRARLLPILARSFPGFSRKGNGVAGSRDSWPASCKDYFRQDTKSR